MDGQSNDNTIDIIREFEPKFTNRLRWVSEKDNGIYDAMNKGLRMATGEVVGVLNSDDFFTTTDVVEQVAQAFSDSMLDAVYGDVHFVREPDLTHSVRHYYRQVFAPGGCVLALCPPIPRFMRVRRCFRKQAYIKPIYKIGGDFEMMVRLFKRFNIKAKYLSIDFVTMRTGGASTKNMGSRLTLLREDTRACRENGIYTHPLLICLKYFYKVLEYRFNASPWSMGQLLLPCSTY